MIELLLPLHSHPMDPKSSWGIMTTPSKFEMQAQVLRMLLPPQGHDQAIASVAFSLNGSKIFLRSYDKTI
jgi:hypothetical protein